MNQLLKILLFCLITCSLSAQEPERKSIRVVDSLAADEKVNRNTVILQSELDSMIRIHNDALPRTVPQEARIINRNDVPLYLVISACVALVAIAILLFVLFRNQKKSVRTVYMLRKQIQHLELAAYSSGAVSDASPHRSRSKTSLPALERKIQSLTMQLDKAAGENQELKDQLADYSNARHDFESIKQQMMEVYKIRNYPGFDKEKTETEIVRSLLDTERSVALYAYEHFLKPVIAIADANKNNPARINPDEREKLLDLLISLSLLYSEYLYLRINELSVGGKIVERIGNLKNGHSFDTSSLKALNTDHGSRALVLRMVLDKTSIQHLSYPVFDETNLNLS
jgi:hypothetical protein